MTGQPELPDMPARPPDPPAISEKELMQAVLDVAHLFGWRRAHFRSVPVKRGPRVRWETPVQADGKGFPDLVLVRDKVLWIELKVGANTLTAEQAAWIAALKHAGQETHVWTEHDWVQGIVEATLRRQHGHTSIEHAA